VVAVEILPNGFFTDVPSDKHFWLHDGRTIKNLAELLIVLKEINPGLFNHHVNSERNDFANWVINVIDVKTGEELLPIREKNDFQRAVEKKLEKPKKEESQAEEKPLLKFSSSPKLSFKQTDEIQGVPQPELNTSTKLNEILKKEREIEARERIIQNLEERIEKKLEGEKPHKFFSKEFVEGLLIGILILLICGLLYLKFFMPN
jgi:hypothetical protein